MLYQKLSKFEAIMNVYRLQCADTVVHTGIPEFLIRFEAWAKLAQQWLVCAPLGTHLEPINKELMLLVTI